LNKYYLKKDYNTEDLIVDIISSNTHSVVNLVSPWVHKRKEEITEWGKKNHPEIVEVMIMIIIKN